MSDIVLELADVTFRRDGRQIIDGISLTVREVVLTGITATVDTPLRWQPSAAAR